MPAKTSLTFQKLDSGINLTSHVHEKQQFFYHFFTKIHNYLSFPTTSDPLYKKITQVREWHL